MRLRKNKLTRGRLTRGRLTRGRLTHRRERLTHRRKRLTHRRKRLTRGRKRLTRGRKGLTRGRKRMNVRKPKRGGGQNDAALSAKAEYAAERKSKGLPELGTHSSLTELAETKTNTLNMEIAKSTSAVEAEENNLRDCNTKLSLIETKTFPQLEAWRHSLHMTIKEIIHSSDISYLENLKKMLTTDKKWPDLDDSTIIDQDLQKWAVGFLLEMVEEEIPMAKERQQAMIDLENKVNEIKIEKFDSTKDVKIIQENIKNLEAKIKNAKNLGGLDKEVEENANITLHDLRLLAARDESGAKNVGLRWLSTGGFFGFGRNNTPMDYNAWKEVIKQRLSSPNWRKPPQPAIYAGWIPEIMKAEEGERGMGYKKLGKLIDNYKETNDGAYAPPVGSWQQRWSVVDNLKEDKKKKDAELEELKKNVGKCNSDFEEMMKMVPQNPIFIIEKERLLAEFYEKKLKAQTTKETIDHWYEENKDKINNLEINDELKNNLRDKLTKLVAELKEGPLTTMGMIQSRYSST